MEKSHNTKTLSATLQKDAATLFQWLSDVDHLPQWHPGLCQSLDKSIGRLTVMTPRGAFPLTLLRDDRAMVLDLVLQLEPGLELLSAIRVFANGESSDVVLTLVRPQGLMESLFHEHYRWAESALRELRNIIPTLQDAPPAEPQTTPSLAPQNAEALEETTAASTPPSAPAALQIPASARKLFVGNLPFDWTEEHLKSHFAASGEVTAAAVARFRQRGRSRGFGFVEMATEEAAQSAITSLHGSEAGSRKIVVRIAHNQENRDAARASRTEPTEPSPASSEIDPDQIGNLREPPPTRRPPQRHTGARRPGRAGGNRRAPGHRPRRTDSDMGIVNNSGGYEIFKRRRGGGFEPPAAPSMESRHAPMNSIEASPYMDDTGDIENRGNRRPRRRR